MQKSVIVLILLPTMLTACSAHHVALAPTSSAPDASETLAASRVAAALAFGAAHADAKSRAEAARVLDALGARPADEHEPNLPRTWEAIADRGQTVPPPFRGRILGPAYRTGQVAPGGIMTTEQLFMGGQPASLAVAPSAGAKLSVVVRDARGATLCQKPVTSPTAACYWTPPFATRAHIEISNQGAGEAKYYLVVD